MVEDIKSKEVIAVVVSYNRKELLKECVTALLKQKYNNLKIMIIDNASTDGTYNFISELIDNERILYLNTGSNLGGAGGFNYGIKQTVKTGCDYVWVMDDDCIVQPNSLSALLNFADKINNDFGFLSSVVKWKDDSICNMNIQRTSISKKVKDFTFSQKIRLASFVSMFIKREVIEDVGLPIKDFFIWGDDWEYSNRISKRYNCYLVSDSTVTHKSNQNMGVDISKDAIDRLDRYKYAYRNECYFYRKNGIKGILYLFLKICLHTLKVVFKSKGKKLMRLRIIYKNTFKGFRFNPIIEKIKYERKENI